MRRGPAGLRTRKWLAAAGLLLLAAILVVVAIPDEAPPRVSRADLKDRRLFAPDSVWNAPLSPASKLAPDSEARVAALAGDIEGKITDDALYPAIAAESYSTPIYVVPRDQERVEVELPDAGEYGDPLRRALSEGVPIPEQAQPAEGTDGHMTIVQPATDTLWEFWRAHRGPNGWEASWGGAMRDVSTNPGYFSNSVWPDLGEDEGWNWGSTATSLPVAAGTMTIDELGAAYVPHAVAASIPDACAELVVKPARRGDGEDTSRDCMPEGAHLRLDPGLDIEALGLSPVTETVARAAQDYGIVVRDVTRGGSVSLFAEAPQRDSPYGDADGPFDGLPPWRTLEDFPWQRLKLLALEPCGPPPCSD